MTNNQKMNLIISLVKRQFPKGADGNLVVGILAQALKDSFCFEYIERYMARRFLRGDMYMIMMAGVEPEWIRSVIKKIGLDISPQTGQLCPKQQEEKANG